MGCALAQEGEDLPSSPAERKSEGVSERQRERERDSESVSGGHAFLSECKHCCARTSTWSSEIPVTENSAGTSVWELGRKLPCI